MKIILRSNKITSSYKIILLTVIILLFIQNYSLLLASGSGTDTLSRFDRFNSKAEKLFKILPVPIYSYSTEAGHIYGLAKYNLFKLSKNDKVSQSSRISEVLTFSTKGRMNISVSTDLIWGENKFIVLGFINYKKQPEYILGIGNDVSIDDVEQVLDKLPFVFATLRELSPIWREDKAA